MGNAEYNSIIFKNSLL